ncbi:hypothetical protein D3C78_1707950 [compost metagenome]
MHIIICIALSAAEGIHDGIELLTLSELQLQQLVNEMNAPVHQCAAAIPFFVAPFGMERLHAKRSSRAKHMIFSINEHNLPQLFFVQNSLYIKVIFIEPAVLEYRY